MLLCFMVMTTTTARLRRPPRATVSRAFSRAKENWHSLSTPSCFIGCTRVCVCVSSTRHIYIFSHRPRGGDPFTCYYAQRRGRFLLATRLPFRSQRRQRVKTPIMTLETRAAEIPTSVLFFYYYIFDRGTSKPEMKNATEIRHETDATMHIIIKYLRQDDIIKLACFRNISRETSTRSRTYLAFSFVNKSMTKYTFSSLFQSRTLFGVLACIKI